MNRRSVEGQRVVVTGGSSGIGRQLAIDLVKRGATVVIASHDPERLQKVEQELRVHSPISFAQHCDVRSQDDVDALAQTIRDRMGGIDVLVNNAGFATYRTFADSDPAELIDTIDVNLNGVIRCTRAVLPFMIERKAGTVLNTASIAGRLPLTPNGTYTAAKHGVFALSKILDDELARFGINVCVLCPGRVETSFFDHETFQQRAHRPETRYTVPVEQVSQGMIHAIETGKRLTFVPRTIGVLTWGYGAVPFLAAPMFRRLNRSRVESYYEERAATPEGKPDHDG